MRARPFSLLFFFLLFSPSFSRVNWGKSRMLGRDWGTSDGSSEKARAITFCSPFLFLFFLSRIFTTRVEIREWSNEKGLDVAEASSLLLSSSSSFPLSPGLLDDGRANSWGPFLLLAEQRVFLLASFLSSPSPFFFQQGELIDRAGSGFSSRGEPENQVVLRRAIFFFPPFLSFFSPRDKHARRSRGGIEFLTNCADGMQNFLFLPPFSPPPFFFPCMVTIVGKRRPSARDHVRARRRERISIFIPFPFLFFSSRGCDRARNGNAHRRSACRSCRRASETSFSFFPRTAAGMEDGDFSGHPSSPFLF